MLNWFNLALSFVAIATFVWMRIMTTRTNKREYIKHNSNPVFIAHGFKYEAIKMPWLFYVMLALAIVKLIEQVAILSGACN